MAMSLVKSEKSMNKYTELSVICGGVEYISMRFFVFCLGERKRIIFSPAFL